ncbi:MAG: TonB family protein [Pseudomonadota bacterium]
MIRSSPAMKIALAAVSLGIHGAVAVAFFSRPQVEIEGSSGEVVQARLGNSFADFAAGAVVPDVSEIEETEREPADEPTPPVQKITVDRAKVARSVVETTEQLRPRETQNSHAEPIGAAQAHARPLSRTDTVETAPSEANQTQPATPKETPPQIAAARSSAVAAESVSVMPPIPMDAMPPDTAFLAPDQVVGASEAEVAAQPEADVTPPQSATSDIMAARDGTSTLVSPRQSPRSVPEALRPSAPQSSERPPAPLAAETPAPETVAATSPEAVETSPRPARRQPRPKPEAPAPSAQPTSPGNSRQNAVAGDATGATDATSTRQSASSGQSTASGNAAASNYAGEVMRRISRVRKPRVNVRGTAVIRFSVSSSGGIAALSIAKSSGSNRLDSAALDVIKKAAPFPTPPPGAGRDFRIEIEGRG